MTKRKHAVVGIDGEGRSREPVRADVVVASCGAMLFGVEMWLRSLHAELEQYGGGEAADDVGTIQEVLAMAAEALANDGTKTRVPMPENTTHVPLPEWRNTHPYRGDEEDGIDNIPF